ncbi:putative cyclin-K [Apostichopus japonicus]|uniref:Putative cyclin-K n=1 Tax=Stichopus japonicus TaxID=307972 RepID=A0A2G8L3A7_STIJA|nr:putative cyclin-K [Apostichopus japonicus]
MPCWFYEPEDLLNTPSMKDGMDEGTEARYRREGARFIIEAGTAMKLRYDTMATGVVYFHRFYMFHTFKEFPRYRLTQGSLWSPCDVIIVDWSSLFIFGWKSRRNTKKCKDIIRIAKEILPDHHFAAFGDDPKEEIMTYERILLQTIKFDLQVEHPYSYLLKYAKTFKGDKEKIQKLVQMAWTFVNDSLCTTLCLQWEPHITAVAFLYLAGRLSKSDLLDWSGKSTKNKWWESLSEDVSLDIMEDQQILLGCSRKPLHQIDKSPLTSDAEKSKDEPRAKHSKSEVREAHTTASTPPPSKSKSVTIVHDKKQPVQNQCL